MNIENPNIPSSVLSTVKTDENSEPLNPGQATGIISLLLGFVGLAPFGLVLSIMSTVQSRKAKMPATLGVMGILINIVAVFTLVFLILVFSLSR